MPAHRRNLGMVFQAYSLFPNMNALDNAAFGLEVRKISTSRRRARAGELLDLVGLTGLAGRFPHELSGGQQQRVALARALCAEPRLLLLDEPLSALDARVRAQLRDEIRRIQLELGMTTLFVTHDQDEALSMSDRVGVMRAGNLEQLGTPAEVYSSPATEFVAQFVGSVSRLARGDGGRGSRRCARYAPGRSPAGAGGGASPRALPGGCARCAPRASASSRRPAARQCHPCVVGCVCSGCDRDAARWRRGGRDAPPAMRELRCQREPGVDVELLDDAPSSSSASRAPARLRRRGSRVIN